MAALTCFFFFMDEWRFSPILVPVKLRRKWQDTTSIKNECLTSSSGRHQGFKSEKHFQCSAGNVYVFKMCREHKKRACNHSFPSILWGYEFKSFTFSLNLITTRQNSEKSEAYFWSFEPIHVHAISRFLEFSLKQEDITETWRKRPWGKVKVQTNLENAISASLPSSAVFRSLM